MVQNTLGELQSRRKALYDRKIHGQPFNPGDSVWLYSTVIPKDGHRKLHHPWTGPYLILERLSDVNYKIQSVSNPSCFVIVHFDRWKICVPGTRFQSETLPSQPMDNSRPPQNIGD
uniref:Integrase p58-like C-terminal domain-containing protein n=1 Tax=Amphimedon queenslandica TaxID=400682 RepID=A0A1X7TSJ9_AMPQE